MPALTADAAESEVLFRAHAFHCEAMTTAFTIRVVEDDPVYARQAAGAAFEELELLERLLSCHEPNSDVSRINGLSTGQKTVVAAETFACLQVALDVQRKTGGAFDVCYAAEHGGSAERFRLDRARRTVQVLESGVRVDLGGIGKGFALDQMACLLHEWDIAAAMLWASTSTVLAFGKPLPSQDWMVHFGPPGDRWQRAICGTALSASGTAIKGEHIRDPRTRNTACLQRSAWAAAPTAAMADALSTAFMVMTQEEIRRCCQQDPQFTAYIPVAERDR